MLRLLLVVLQVYNVFGSKDMVMSSKNTILPKSFYDQATLPHKCTYNFDCHDCVLKHCTWDNHSS